MVKIPGSKSLTQRYVLISAFTNCSLRLSNVAFCEDDLRAISIAEACGKNVQRSEHELTITGDFRCPEQVSCGDSGTSYRLTIGLLAGRGCKTKVDISRQLSSRPIYPLLESLSGNGVFFRQEVGTMWVDGTYSRPGMSKIRANLSSQFVSSLLLFQAMMSDDRKIEVTGPIVSEKYIELTRTVMNEFGVIVMRSGNSFTLTGDFSGNEVAASVEGDFSSAAYVLALGALASESGIRIEGLSKNSLQPDSLAFQKHDNGGWLDDPFDNKVSRCSLRRIVVDCNITPDLAPVAAVVGIFSRNGASLLNGERLRTKESDRLAEIERLVRIFGGRLSGNADSLLILPGEKVPKITILEFSEHRMIMAGIIAGIVSGQTILHRNVELIDKSYPDFLRTLEGLGLKVDQIE